MHFSENCCILGIRHAKSSKVQGTVKVRKFKEKKFESSKKFKMLSSTQILICNPARSASHGEARRGVHQVRGRSGESGGRSGESEEAQGLRKARGLVERFDRQGTELFELFRSGFGQNSFKRQEFSLENPKNSEIFNIF